MTDRVGLGGGIVFGYSSDAALDVECHGDTTDADRAEFLTGRAPVRTDRRG